MITGRTDGQTDRQTDRQSATQYAAPPREDEGRIIRPTGHYDTANNYTGRESREWNFSAAVTICHFINMCSQLIVMLPVHTWA